MGRGTRHPAVDAVRAWLGRTVVRPVEARLARVVRAEVEQAVRDAEFRARRDLLAVGERDAALSSARFAHRTMPTAREFHDPSPPCSTPSTSRRPVGWLWSSVSSEGGRCR
jgi:hypothetical protein